MCTFFLVRRVSHGSHAQNVLKMWAIERAEFSPSKLYSDFFFNSEKNIFSRAREKNPKNIFCPKLLRSTQIDQWPGLRQGPEPLIFGIYFLFPWFRTVPGLKTFRKYQKWKDHTFLHLSYTQLFFSTLEKIFFSSSKKNSKKISVPKKFREKKQYFP